MSAGEADTMESHQFILQQRTIHVWFADLTDLSGQLDAMFALLSADERERSGRFTMERLRHRFVLRRGLLRLLLGRCTGRPAADLRFEYGSHDKPGLVGGPAFNLADSEDSVVIAVAADGCIGADIERIRQIESADSLAERFFSPAEYAALRSLPGDIRNDAFLRCWVRKEAFVKAAGAGLSLPLDQFTVEVAPGRPAMVLEVDEALRPDVGSAVDWSLFDLSGLPDTTTAVAAQGTGWRLESFFVSGDLSAIAP